MLEFDWIQRIIVLVSSVLEDTSNHDNNFEVHSELLSIMCNISMLVGTNIEDDLLYDEESEEGILIKELASEAKEAVLCIDMFGFLGEDNPEVAKAIKHLKSIVDKCNNRNVEIERARLELNYIYSLPAAEVEIVRDLVDEALSVLVNAIETNKLSVEEANEWLDLLVEDESLAALIIQDFN